MNRAFSYLTKNLNVYQKDYKYTAKDYNDPDNVCAKNINYAPNSKLRDYFSIPEDKVGFNNLLTRLAERPVAVAIQADQPAFRYYTEGVIPEGQCDGQSLDHGVLLYGLDHDNDLGDILLVRNSWGERWGEKGKVRI